MIQPSTLYDTAIVGGGILGLWAARHAIKRGERVLLIEKRRLGSGASGGFLGALMPHMPDNWNAKKQLQFDGLSSIGEAVRELEDETGIDCGFRRCGRVIPLTHEKVVPQVERRIEGALANWCGYELLHVQNSASWEAGKSRGSDPTLSWLDPGQATHGCQFDNLSARINPRFYVSALASFVTGHAVVREDLEVVSVQAGAKAGTLLLSDNTILSAGRIIVANGWEAYPLLQPFMEGINEGQPVGRGVMGQAVLVEHRHDDTQPIVYFDGAYVVPHAENRVAIGSTSLNRWHGAPDTFDPDDMAFYERALTLVPELKDAPIVGSWAGVRPRNTLVGRGTSPWLGPVPGHDNLIALIGGFKITLGIAHLDHASA